MLHSLAGGGRRCRGEFDRLANKVVINDGDGKSCAKGLVDAKTPPFRQTRSSARAEIAGTENEGFASLDIGIVDRRDGNLHLLGSLSCILGNSKDIGGGTECNEIRSCIDRVGIVAGRPLGGGSSAPRAEAHSRRGRRRKRIVHD